MAMRLISLSVFFLLLLSAKLFAASGSLAGRVTNIDNREPLVGVNVFLQGTVRGTATDSRGQFRLSDVRVGTYTLVFSIVGYQRHVRTDVNVEEEKEAYLEIALTETPLQTEQVVVTAGKREQSLEEVPVSISVIDATEIKHRNSLTIDDALRYVPGVNMTGPQINIRGSSGYSLGVGSRVLMLLDGVPFISGDTGELIFESIPVGQVDRIEVVKGASSALYGSNALGGVVNVITKPITGIAETSIRTYAGFYNKPSFDQWKWSDKRRFLNGQAFGLSRKFGDFGISLFLSRQLDDGYRQNDYRRRYNGYVKMRHDFSSSSALTLNAGMLYQYSGQFLYWRSLDSALIPPIKHERDRLESKRFYLNSLFSTVMSENLLFTGKVMWSRNNWGFQQTGDAALTESKTDGVRAEASCRLILGSVHTLTLGFDGNLDMIGGAMFAGRTIGGLAVYGQDEVAISDQLTLTIGARCDVQSAGLTEKAVQLNPKFAVAYSPREGTTIRASFGKGFRVPSVAEAFIAAGGGLVRGVPNTDLKPERSSSYEIGFSQALGDFGTIDCAGFRSDFDNLIEPALIVSGQNLEVQWRNVTRARVEGIETSLKLIFFDGELTGNVGYTFVYPKDRTHNDLLKYRPRHLFYSNASSKIGGFNIGADFRYVSRVERIDDELVETGIVPDGNEREEILVADFRVGVDLSIVGFTLTTTFNIKNAFQRNYVELIGNMMPPRTYILSLEAKL
jgi:iron complex outermembrane receptor protein